VVSVVDGGRCSRLLVVVSLVGDNCCCKLYEGYRGWRSSLVGEKNFGVR
jgi:hypothetical protein